MKPTKEVAELIGIHLGDECLCDNGRYKEYALSGDLLEEKEYYDNHVIPLFNKNIAKPLLGKDIKPKSYTFNGVYGFKIFNEKIFKFYKDLGITVGSKINTKIPPKFFKKEYIKFVLRGLFDTDGSLYFEKNRTAKKPINKVPHIKISSVSKPLATQIIDSLKKMDYHPLWKKPYKGKNDKNLNYYVLLYRNRDIKRFIKEIGFNNPKHKTKWEYFIKYGYYVPKLTISERKRALNNNFIN